MIPAWNSLGVIPPIRPGVSGHAPDRSPYQSSLSAVVSMMGTSHARLEIIDGLLRFRDEIRKLGVSVGFQWLNGSFSEDVETLEERDPRDVDVVTFLQLPAGVGEADIVAKNSQLFDNDYVKKAYNVDSYWEVLGEPINAQAIRRVSYWYSMWSHRRDGLWKGFLQVDLQNADDEIARKELARAKVGLGDSL